MGVLMQDDSTRMEPAMALALSANFGSVQRWCESFVQLGRAFGGGTGCLAMVFVPAQGTLEHRWAADVEHAAAADQLMLAYSFGEDGPLDEFVDAIDWAQVYQRYQQAVHAASEPFGATQDDAAQAPLLLDVRRAGVFENAASMIPGARWRDPGAVAGWVRELPTGQPVIVYCVYGHEVGRSTALRLRAAGVQASFLLGGIDGWQAAGRAVAARTADVPQ
jgi:superoxide dismutase, Fe-Mn family